MFSGCKHDSLTFSQASKFLAERIKCAPNSEYCRAKAAPIPEEDPVIQIILFSRFINGFFKGTQLGGLIKTVKGKFLQFRILR